MSDWCCSDAGMHRCVLANQHEGEHECNCGAGSEPWRTNN